MTPTSTQTIKPTTSMTTSSAPSIFCFPNTNALKSAVDSYISQNCATANTTCATRMQYGEIGTWCVKLVTSMAYMFHGASSFNSDLSNWNVGSVTIIAFMFRGATSFNQNLCPWGSKLPNSFDYGTNANMMFHSTNCPNVNSPTNATGPWCANCPAWMSSSVCPMDRCVCVYD